MVEANYVDAIALRKGMNAMVFKCNADSYHHLNFTVPTTAQVKRFNVSDVAHIIENLKANGEGAVCN